MQTSEVLNLAADLIEERGWGRVTWGGQVDSPLCLEGALIAAMGSDPADRVADAFYSCPAYRAVTAYLGRNPRPAHCPVEDALWMWNDTPGRTAAEVIEVLRAAALVEAAREDAALLAEVGAP